MVQPSFAKKLKIPDEITGKNITLRKINLKDAPDLYKLLENPEVTKFLKISPPASITDEEENIKRALKKWKSLDEFTYTIIVRYDSEINSAMLKILPEQTRSTDKRLIRRPTSIGVIVGIVTIWNLNYLHKFGEVGIWLGRNYWHMGINYEALTLILKNAFDNFLLNRLEAKMSVQNLRSEKTFIRLNFTKEGLMRKKINIHGVYHDVYLYSILREEFRGSKI